MMVLQTLRKSLDPLLQKWEASRVFKQRRDNPGFAFCESQWLQVDSIFKVVKRETGKPVGGWMVFSEHREIRWWSGLRRE